MMALGLALLLASAPPPTERARALARAALESAGRGDYDRAVAQLEEAHTLEPDPTYLFNAAQVLEKKGDLVAARQRYERFLREERDPARVGRGRERLEALLDRLPGRLVVEVTPREAQVTVDGKVVPQGVPVELRRGRHAVRASASGYEVAARSVEVAPGVDVHEQISLRPGAVVPPRIVKAARPGTSPWAWALLGTGAAALAAGGVLTALAVGQNGEVERAAVFPDGTVRLAAMSRSDALAAHASAEQKMDAATALYAVGGAAALAGVLVAVLVQPATEAVVTVRPVECGAVLEAGGAF